MARLRASWRTSLPVVQQPRNPQSESIARSPYDSFDGQVALVTGAAMGMGLATAKAFAEAGASVVLADTNDEALRQATDDLTEAGHSVIGVHCDVADERQV